MWLNLLVWNIIIYNRSDKESKILEKERQSNKESKSNQLNNQIYFNQIFVYKIFIVYKYILISFDLDMPTKFWNWYQENDFMDDLFSVVASGNFGEVKKGQFRTKEELEQRNLNRNNWYAGNVAALEISTGRES